MAIMAGMAARTAAAAPVTWLAGIRARVWVEARHFFSRDSAQAYCWLWLLRDDGRVLASRMDARNHGRDEVLPALLAHFDDEEAPPLAGVIEAWPLAHAPVVPLTRWAVSWGHPLQREIRAFADALDGDVLDALGRLEVPGPFFGSVGNYNRLAVCPRPLRDRRLQAIEQFPALVAPLLLEVVGRPDMFGTDEDVPGHAPPRHAGAEPVFAAIDQGRDLVGALGEHYGVDRALVRSALLREPLAQGWLAPELLRLLAAMPAHARPRTRATFEQRLPCLDALPVLAQRTDDIARLAGVFHAGWEATWQALDARFPALPAALRDSRDFLRAAIEQAAPPPLVALDMSRLGLAWLCRRGIASLLDASRRWHAQPAIQHRVDDGLPVSVAPILGTLAIAEGQATEILTRDGLVAEGDDMRHCVGDYWHECVLRATRIFHLVGVDGAVATAQFCRHGPAQEPRYELAQLRGPDNAEVGANLQDLADAIEALMNGDAVHAARMVAVDEAAKAAFASRPGIACLLRPLDLRSRRELRLVLVWCGRQADWHVRPGTLWRGPVAGFAHAQGPQVLTRLVCGDALRLVREPDNPHDALAVRVEWNGHKLGYVPRQENERIAMALDAGIVVEGEIVSLRRDDAWSPIEFAAITAPADALPG